MFDVSLFLNGEHISRRKRKIIPSVGDFIIIDCGEMVKVIEVSHQWDDPNSVQINSTEVEIKEVE